MAKLYKTTMYILDANDEYLDFQEILDEAERGVEDADFINFDNQAVTFEWDNDLQINKIGATQNDYGKYFNKESK